MRWWRPTSLWSVREHQNINKRSTKQLYLALFNKSTANIGRKHVSNDMDFIGSLRAKEATRTSILGYLRPCYCELHGRDGLMAR